MSINETIPKSFQTKTPNIFQKTESYLSVQEEIRNLNKLYEEISIENTKKRNNILLLEKQLESISRAISENIDIVKDATDQLDAENNELSDACQEQQELLQEINEKYLLCIDEGINFDEYPEFELEELRDFLLEVTAKDDENLQFVQNIAAKIPYFSECTSVEEFINKCSLLMKELKRTTNKNKYISTPSKFKPDEKLMKMSLPELKGKIQKMESKYTKIYSKFSRQLADLNNQKHFLEKKYNEFVRLDKQQSSQTLDDSEMNSDSLDQTDMLSTPSKSQKKRIPVSPLVFELASPFRSLMED